MLLENEEDTDTETEHVEPGILPDEGGEDEIVKGIPVDPNEPSVPLDDDEDPVEDLDADE